MRNWPGSAPTSSRHGRAGAGAVYGSPTPGPAVASSTAAVSRTVRVSTCSWVTGPQNSPKSGPSVLRARVGFSPTTPQWAAGNRIDPPMSLPWATGTSPAATAAPAPPLDPPVEWAVFQGLRVAPYASGSVVMVVANSGRLVFPQNTKPAARYRAASHVSSSSRQPASFNARIPLWNGSPAVWQRPSFMSIGTPWNGPSPTSPDPA